MIRTIVTKDIEVGPEDFETEDLLEELARRGASSDIYLDRVIDMLQRERAPTALIELLKGWAQTPVLHETRLAARMLWLAGGS